MNNSSLYGKGIFTTITIYNGEAFLWEKHWRRLKDNAEKVGIDISKHSEQEARKELDEIIAKRGQINGRARLTFFDESPSEIWPSDSDGKTSLLINTGDMRPVPANFRLTVSPYPINSLSPLAGVKSCNYLENLIALETAKKSGFHEAIRLNERGKAASAVMANVFWLKDGKLYTPSLATGCLQGTTREFVMENFHCEEVEAGIEAVSDADAIFLTSAGIGVVSASEFGNIKILAKYHPILDLLPKKK